VIISFIAEIILTIVGLIISIKGQGMSGIESMSPGVIGLGMIALIVLFAVTMYSIVKIDIFVICYFSVSFIKI